MKLRYFFCYLIAVSYFFYAPLSAYAFINKAVPPGVMATVNGEPILLEDVEALHDSAGNILVFRENPEVKSLQEQYGNSLYSLIIYALMSQELEKVGYRVTDEDVAQAEEEVRQDYLGEDFEKSLQEEYLDLNTWRKLMRQRITYQKFQRHILRPRVRLSHEEVEAYYNERYDEFFIPEKVEIIWFQEANNKDILCQDTLAEDGNRPQRGELIRVDVNRLPEKMREDLMKIKPGECTPCRKEGEVFQRAFLRSRYPAHQANLLEAYPRIELVLLEEKLEKVYNEWLEKAISKAKIWARPQFQPETLVK